MKVNKKIAAIITITLLGGGLLQLHNLKYMNTYEKELYNKKMIEFFSEINYLKEKHEMKEKINKKISEISEYMSSNEYKYREEKIRTLEILKRQTGLNITNYRKITFELTYYTNLPYENGGWTITCKGEPLSGNIVANNVIPLDTNIVLEGHGLVKVADKGAESIFSTENRLDVLVERLNGETDQQYLERVNNKGRDIVEGYILYVN